MFAGLRGSQLDGYLTKIKPQQDTKQKLPQSQPESKSEYLFSSGNRNDLQSGLPKTGELTRDILPKEPLAEEVETKSQSMFSAEYPTDAQQNMTKFLGLPDLRSLAQVNQASKSISEETFASYLKKDASVNNESKDEVSLRRSGYRSRGFMLFNPVDCPDSKPSSLFKYIKNRCDQYVPTDKRGLDYLKSIGIINHLTIEKIRNGSMTIQQALDGQQPILKAITEASKNEELSKEVRLALALPEIANLIANELISIDQIISLFQAENNNPMALLDRISASYILDTLRNGIFTGDQFVSLLQAVNGNQEVYRQLLMSSTLSILQERIFPSSQIISLLQAARGDINALDIFTKNNLLNALRNGTLTLHDIISVLQAVDGEINALEMFTDDNLLNALSDKTLSIHDIVSILQTPNGGLTSISYLARLEQLNALRDGTLTINGIISILLSQGSNE